MKILAPKGSTYCSEFMTSIPFGIVNKGVCGCGMSSIALENDLPTIVAVPNVEIILNKVGQYPNNRRAESIVGVYEGVDVAATIEPYLATTAVPKIMVTYDSFPKLLRYINNDWHIVVDEFSDLLDVYNYRGIAVRRLLACLKRFTNVSYISATPIKPEYYPDELVGLDYTEIEWQDIAKCMIVRQPSSHPYKAAAVLIARYIMAGEEGIPMPNGHNSKAALIFINSVTAIKQLINKTKLRPDQVRIICADKKENRDKLGKKYKIQTALDPEPLITFVTCKSFKGSDYYSEAGTVYIISNTHNLNTLVSIDTDAVQIAGRIRTLSNPFRQVIFHIYNTDPSLMSKEDFTAQVNKKIKTTEALLSGFSRLVTPEEKASQINLYKTQKEDAKDDHYVMLDHINKPFFNYYLIKNDWRRWETSHAVYTEGAGVVQGYRDAGFEVSAGDHVPATKFSKEFLHYLTTMDFKDKCIQYIEKKEDVDQYFSTFAPDIQAAYALLGAKKMKALSLNPTRIRQALEDLDPYVQTKLELAVLQTFQAEQFYSLKEIKTQLQAMYDGFSMYKKAKATDLSQWFTISQKNLKNTNGLYLTAS